MTQKMKLFLRHQKKHPGKSIKHIWRLSCIYFRSSRLDPTLSTASSLTKRPRRTSTQDPTPLRTTRSRSQTPALLEEQEVVRLAPTSSLDVLSEDEEEVANVTVKDAEVNSKLTEDESPPLLSGMDRRGILAMLLLLMMLMGSSFVVGRLQGDAVSERVIVLLAYSLAPFRAIVDYSVKLSAKDAGVPGVVKEIDYDLLAARILDSERFRRMLDLISTEKVKNMGLEIQGQIEVERNARSQGLASSKEQYLRLEEQLGNTKSELDAAVQRAKVEIVEREATKDESHILVTDQSIETLKHQIKDLEVKLTTLQEQTVISHNDSPTAASETAMADIRELQGRLVELEKAGQGSVEAVKQCCNKNAEITQTIEDKLNTLLNSEISELKKRLHKEFTGKQEMQDLVEKLAVNIDSTMENAIKKISEESKKDNMKFVEEQIAHLKNSLVHEIEANLSTVASAHTAHTSGQVPAHMISSPQEVARIVREALTKYDADKTGLFDFALESAGGSIVTTKCTEPYQATSAVMSVWGLPFWWDANSPRTILQPGSAPGQCWAFRGSYGTVVIKLSSPIFISAVTIEHISSLLSPDGHIHSAPATLSMAGLTPGDNLSSLLNFTYSASGDPVQTFWLGDEARTQRFETVELTVHKNHGHPDYTCLYRVRVHGTVKHGGSGLH